MKSRAIRHLLFIVLPAAITEAILAYGVSTQQGACVPSSILSFAGIMTHLPSAFVLGNMDVLHWWWITVPFQTAIWVGIFGVIYGLFFGHRVPRRSCMGTGFSTGR